MKRNPVKIVGLFVILLIDVSISSIGAMEPEPNSLVLAGEPILTIEENGTGTLSYSTLFPTPPGRLYYGTALPEQRLAYPRYRYTASEKSDINSDTGMSELSTDHKITFPVGRMEDYFGDLFKGSMVVHYRMEIYHPQAKQSRFFDRRFRYEKSEDGTYRKAVCIIEGPFIDCIEENRALISWTCDEPVQGSVQIRDRGKIRMHLGHTEKSREKHEIVIDGLKADTNYQYRVLYGPQISDMSGWTEWFSFRTAPKFKSNQEFSFAMMCDSRAGLGGGERSVNGVNVRAVRKYFTNAYLKDVDMVFFPGDLINGHTASERDFREQLQAWKRAAEPVGHTIPIYETMGNHEFWKVPAETVRESRGKISTETVFAEEFVNPMNAPEPEADAAPPYTETVYSFDYGNSHFSIVNTNYWYRGMEETIGNWNGNIEGFILSNQMNWLREDLNSARERGLKHLFVFTHEPAFPTGGHTHDAMYYHGKIPEVLEMRDEFWSILSENEVVAAFFGDEHNYSRSLIGPKFNPAFPNDVWHIVSGGCGAPFYPQEMGLPWTPFVEKFSSAEHWCLIRVNGGKVELEVYSENEKLVDQVRLR